MLKDNRLLIGLGIGLIVGALLLELMNLAASGVNQADKSLINNDLDINSYTVEQLQDIADALNYQIFAKSEAVYTQEELDKAVTAALQEENTELNKEDTTIQQQPMDPSATSEDILTEETVNYRVTITSGMVMGNVADLLLQAQLISDSDEFKKEISQRKLNNSIQIGTFEFDEKPTISELITIITSKR